MIWGIISKRIPPARLPRRPIREIGIDHGRARSKAPGEFEGQTFDYVITLCDAANETCPLFFGGVKRIHLGFEDPARITGTEEEVLTAFRRVRDQIREIVEIYLRNAERAYTTDQDGGKIK